MCLDDVLKDQTQKNQTHVNFKHLTFKLMGLLTYKTPPLNSKLNWLHASKIQKRQIKEIYVLAWCKTLPKAKTTNTMSRKTSCYGVL